MAWGDGAWAEGQPGQSWTMQDGRARWRVGPKRWKKSGDEPASNPFMAPTQSMPPVQPLDGTSSVTPDQPVQASPASSPEGGGFDLGKYLTLGQGAQPGMMTPGQMGLLAFGANLLANKNKRGAAGGALLEGVQASQFAAQQGERAKQQALENARQAKLDARTDEKYAAEKAQAQARQGALAKLTPEEQQQAALMGDDYWKQRAESLFKEAKPPTSRTINMGGLEVSQEWDPATKSWTEIGRGSRWQPQQGATPYQQAQLDLDRQKFDWLKTHPADGGEPMVEVYDPASPTGTSYAPRSQAAGKPGKPDSNGITIDDGKGGKITIGGRTPGGQSATVQNDAVKADRQADLTWKSADDALTAFEDRLKKQGMDVLPGADKQETGTQYKLVINELRKLTESGALQKADLEYLQGIIQDPTTLSAVPNAIGNFVGTGSTITGTLGQIKAVRDYLKNVRNRTSEVYAPGAPPPAGSTPQTGGQAREAPAQIKGDDDYAKLPSGALFVGPDGKQRRKP